MYCGKVVHPELDTGHGLIFYRITNTHNPHYFRMTTAPLTGYVDNVRCAVDLKKLRAVFHAERVICFYSRNWNPSSK